MLTFENKIVELMTDYKAITKKHFPRAEWTQKMDQLGLKRKTLRQDDEITLFHKAHRVASELETFLKQDKNTSSWYSGLDEFYQHLKNLLDEYHLENQHVVHHSQLASRALVDAFQIISLPEMRRSEQMARRLEDCAHTIAKYGNRDQQDMFAKALKSSQAADVNFFLPLVHSFEKYLQNFAAFFGGAMDAEA